MEYIIWLQQVLGAGNGRTSRILDYFGSALNIFNSDEKKLIKSGLFTSAEISKIKTKTLSEAIKIKEECRENGIDIITYKDKKYPFCLSVLPDFPLVLYVKGNMPDFESIPTICIVGPRKVSEYGKRAAYSLSFRLALSGFIIVSGGALGTDTYVHAGALKSGGITVLCLGCGILSDYLSQNAKLRETVSKSGCLISEYPPKVKPTKYSFPIRNRIMAALSLGTVVIEAGEKSGALITANHSLEQGRDVFVIPGSPNERQYEGSNRLLRDGAKPLLDVSDIFNEYIFRFPDKISIEKAYSKPIISENEPQFEEKNKKIKKDLPETLSNEAKIVYNHLDKQNFSPEEIDLPDFSPQQILACLTELEMEFLINALPGGRYERL